jgi:RNA polymerase sigma-32 factor
MTPIFDRSLHGPIDADHERVLLQQWRTKRDPAAGRVLVESQLRFVFKLAHRLRHYGIPIEVLVSQGALGLLEALERFDLSRDVRFITYAALWVRAFLLEYVRRHASLVFPGGGSKRAKLFFGLRRARAQLASAFGDQLSEDDIDAALAHRFQSSPERVRDMSRLLEQGDASLDAQSTNGRGPTTLQLLHDANDDQETRLADSEVEHVVRRRMAAAVDRLSSRERIILERRLYADEPETLRQVARRLGVSRQRVSQIEEELKTKLRVTLADLDVRRRAA